MKRVNCCIVTEAEGGVNLTPDNAQRMMGMHTNGRRQYVTSRLVAEEYHATQHVVHFMNEFLGVRHIVPIIFVVRTFKVPQVPTLISHKVPKSHH